MFATTLTTDRLILRPIALADARSHHRRVAGDPEVTRYLSGVKTGTLAETEEFIRKSVEDRSNGVGAVWAIHANNEEGPWGTIGVTRAAPSVVLGYALAREKWGRGWMTEGVSAVLESLWNDRAVWRVDALCHVDHAASARVLEKCGLRREGVARRRLVMPRFGSEPQDCLLYAQVRDDVG